jgi:hypothetical protein
MSGDAPDLGLCCACAIKAATGILMLQRRAPTSGKGWGCVVCHLPLDGAVAVLCDDCKPDAVRFVCDGYPKDGRVPIETLTDEVFDHDPAQHPEEARA